MFFSIPSNVFSKFSIAKSMITIGPFTTLITRIKIIGILFLNNNLDNFYFRTTFDFIIRCSHREEVRSKLFCIFWQLMRILIVSDTSSCKKYAILYPTFRIEEISANLE